MSKADALYVNYGSDSERLRRVAWLRQLELLEEVLLRLLVGVAEVLVEAVRLGALHTGVETHIRPTTGKNPLFKSFEELPANPTALPRGNHR